ncbi:MAG: hypothetical protein M1820_000219 [Bogoriella megaspora]|nr:MAG: hypothetical protein M1820_000219 [Bogoriella megaspora]
MRLLLLKQDRVTQLEQELIEVDNNEEKELFLGNSRRDVNQKRKDVLDKLDKAFSDYDNFLQRTNFVLNLPLHARHQLEGLKKYVDSAGSIAETEYLSPFDYGDLVNIGPSKETPLPKFYPAVQNLVDHYNRFISKFSNFAKHDSGKSDESERANVISDSAVRSITRAMTAALAVVLLLVPTILLNVAKTTLVRFIIVFIAATLFVSVLTVASTVGMGEIFAAGAAYAAVLVVFVSGNGIGGP